MAKKELIARLEELGVLLNREVSTTGSEVELKLRVTELEEELQDDTSDVDPDDDAAASGEAGEQTPAADAGGESSPAGTETDTKLVTTGELVTVETRVTLHIDALHATKNERLSIVEPDTPIRVSPGDAADLIAQGLAAEY